MTFEVGDYRATELLAAGASAQVWRGQRSSTGEPVALKVFPPDQWAAVRREAALASAVDHPHLVSVLDVVADDHRVVLVTEYAAGGDLAELLGRQGRLTPGQTLTVLIPLASALATAHERQVVHGDVFAGNIVFDQAGRPLLADLGAARAAMESGRPVQATPCDAAPELARAGAPTPATDLFSLGSVALACLTGRPAWPADDLRDVVIQAAAGQWPDLPDDAAPAPLVAAVRSLLEHDADRRPGAASLVLDLRSAGRPEPLDLTQDAGGRSSPTSAGPMAGRPPSPRRHGRQDDDLAAADEWASPGWVDPTAARPGWPSGGRPDERTTAPSRALTRARPDAAAANAAGGAPDAGRMPGRWTRWGLLGGAIPALTSGRLLRITALAVVGVVVAVVAGLVGLRWADSGRARPVAVQQLAPAPVSSPAGSPGSSRAGSPGGAPRSTAPAPSTGSAHPQTVPTPTRRTVESTAPNASTTRAPAGGAGPPRTTAAASPRSGGSTTAAAVPRGVDWAATVRALDQARSRALVSRDPTMLDAVYTSTSAARSADAQTIRTLVADGLRVSGAEHRLVSVQPVTGAASTFLVRDTLPSYDVLGVAGAVVGRTPARPAAPRVMVLVDTAAGYRISEVRTP